MCRKIKILVLAIAKKKCKCEQQGMSEPLEKAAERSEVVILAGSAGWC